MLLVAHRTPATRAGCEQLAAAGARVFEADLQIDDDGHVVVSHYLPFGGLWQRDNWKVRWHTRAVHDPKLADIAAVVPAGCDVLLDLKEKAAQRRPRLVAALIDRLGDDGAERFIVCGGHPGDLDHLRGAGLRTWRTVGNRRDLAAVLAGDRLPDEAVTVRHTLLSPRVVEELHERARVLVAWTVNSVARARLLGRLGIDGVTTDSIAVMRDLAREPERPASG